MDGNSAANTSLQVQRAPIDYYPISMHRTSKSAGNIRTDLNPSSHFQVNITAAASCTDLKTSLSYES